MRSTLLLNCLTLGLVTSTTLAAPVAALPTIDKSVKLQPRIGASMQSGAEQGDGSAFGSIYGFVPFGQAQGLNTFYTEAKLNLGADDAWGSNLRLGYRTLLPASALVLGAYVGWDARHTESGSTFQQLGFGADLQAEQWELRFNGYLPVGSTRQQTAYTDTGTSYSDLHFSENRLLYSSYRRQRWQYEAAAAGLDVEVGYQLTRWQSGNLFLYGGAYYQDIPTEAAYVGIQGRLKAQLNENWSAGLTLTSDRNFGTNLSIQVSATLGGRSESSSTSEKSAIARLGAPVQRRDTITVDQQFTEQVEQQTDQVAINPETGEAWRFVHVAGGATGGDGSYENPFGEVTAAADMAATAGNDVIYVDSGTNPGMDGFTVPENVQVLSTGVEQWLATSNVGTVQLPGSGTGILPLINDSNSRTTMVSMGNGSTLSGFGIEGGDIRAVGAFNVSNVVIDRNEISRTGNSAGTVGTGLAVSVSGSNVATNITITDNQIVTSSTDTRAINIQAVGGSTLSNLTLSSNTVLTQGGGTSGKGSDALTFLVYGGSIAENISISNNSFSTQGSSNAYPVSLFINSTSQLTDFSLSGNTISSQGTSLHGIAFFSYGQSTTTSLMLDNNTILTTGQNARGINVNAYGSSNISNLAITNNVVEQAGNDSVRIRELGSGTICISQFTGNQSLNPGVYDSSGYDLRLRNNVEFVGFDDVATNNTGFDDINGSPASQPSSCRD